MSSGKPVSRVSSGVPWWLWLLLLVLTAGVVGGTLLSMVPADPQEIFETGLEAAEEHDHEVLKTSIARLAAYPDFADQRTLLEGIDAVMGLRAPKAMELLTEVRGNPELKGIALPYLALAYRGLGQIDMAIAALREAVDEDPAAVAPRMALATTYLNLGALSLAADEADAILELEPDNEAAQALAGNVYWEMRDFQQAAAHYGEALKTPGQRATVSPKVVENYLVSLMRQNLDDQVAEFGTENLALITDDTLRAEIHLRQGDEAALNNMLEKIKELQEEMPQDIKVKAHQAVKAGDMQRAHVILTQVVTLIPRDRQVWELLRDTCVAIDKAKEAEICQQNIERLDELSQEYTSLAKNATDRLDNADAWLRLGELAREIGDYEKFYTWHQRAAVIDQSKTRAVAEKQARMRTGQKPLVPFLTEGAVQGEPAETENSAGTEADDTSASDSNASGAEGSPGADQDAAAPDSPDTSPVEDVPADTDASVVEDDGSPE